MTEVTDEKRIIKYQLGRQPKNFGRVSRYCPFDKPCVLFTVPYDNNEGVFPTSYWLSCPYLVKEVSRLEDTGMIKELTDKLKRDQDFRNKLMSAHQRYASGRYKRLKREDIKNIKEKSGEMLNVLKNSGVGGIMDKRGIKCLHSHLADYLVNGCNPVGRAVWHEIEWPENCEICDEYSR